VYVQLLISVNCKYNEDGNYIRTVTEIKLKFFKNEIIIEITIKPKWKQGQAFCFHLGNRKPGPVVTM